MEDVNIIFRKLQSANNMQGNIVHMKAVLRQIESFLREGNINPDEALYECLDAAQMDLLRTNWHLNHISDALQSQLWNTHVDERMV